MFPIDRRKDVAIDIGIGIANDHLVFLVDDTIVVSIGEMDIARYEVLGVAGGILHVEVAILAGGTCLCIGGKDALGLVSIEQSHGVAHGCEDVVIAINRRGIVAIRQLLHLVGIMSHAGSYLHMPVLADDGLARNGEFKALVLQFSTISPIGIDTADGVLEGHQGEQVGGAVDVIVEVNAHTIVQQVALEADVKLLAGFPFNLVVTDIGELQTRGDVIETHGGEAGTCGIVANVVIATHVKATLQAEIVDTGMFGEPLLIGHHPSKLDAGEDSPLHTSEAQASRILAKSAVCLCRQRQGGEIAIHVVIVNIAIPAHVFPHVVRPGNMLIAAG